VEKRSATDGTLDPAFADAGVLELAWLSRAADIDVHDGGLYVLGTILAGDTTVTRLASGDAMPDWIGFSTMDEPWCVTVDATGVFLGGGRDREMHLERWALDGSPIYARTFGADLLLPPAVLTDIAIEPGGNWVHSVGYHTRDGHRDWYYDRRALPDGLLYT